MGAITGRLSSHIVEFYFLTAVQTTLTYAGLNTAFSASASIGNVIDASSPLTNERAIIDLPIYSDTTMSKLVGQGDPGTFDLTIVNDFSVSNHTTIRDDAGTTERGFGIRVNNGGTDETLIYFSGYIANSALMFGQGEAIQLELSIARTGGYTVVHQS